MKNKRNCDKEGITINIYKYIGKVINKISRNNYCTWEGKYFFGQWQNQVENSEYSLFDMFKNWSHDSITLL